MTFSFKGYFYVFVHFCFGLAEANGNGAILLYTSAKHLNLCKIETSKKNARFSVQNFSCFLFCTEKIAQYRYEKRLSKIV